MTAPLSLAGALLLALPLTPAHAQDGATLPACPTGTDSAAAPVVRVVMGAPYSAQGTSETTTLTTTGRRVVRQSIVRVWRDSDGRTRTEYQISSISGPLPVEINGRVTVIDDPAVRERYLQRPDGALVTQPIAPCRLASEPDLSVGPPRPAHLPVNVSRPVKLGERRIDGEVVTGSRVEATIPAGTLGNDQPMKMSAEQWYGKDLQVVVEATYQDPRGSETRYRLRDIQRSEPDASLFRPQGPPPRRK